MATNERRFLLVSLLILFLYGLCAVNAAEDVAVSMTKVGDRSIRTYLSILPHPDNVEVQIDFNGPNGFTIIKSHTFTDSTSIDGAWVHANLHPGTYYTVVTLERHNERNGADSRVTVISNAVTIS